MLKIMASNFTVLKRGTVRLFIILYLGFEWQCLCWMYE